MKLLLDESIPRQLAASSPEIFDIQTVPQMGWAGRQNGLLLELAADHEFDAVITADQGIEHQQNLAELPIMVIVMIAHRTRVKDLESLVPQVLDLLKSESENRVYRVPA
jgi:predicted nuclease of predicted toxin-antitoxin system